MEIKINDRVKVVRATEDDGLPFVGMSGRVIHIDDRMWGDGIAVDLGDGLIQYFGEKELEQR